MTYLPEMVTDCTLWDALPDPFDISIDARTWNYYIECAIFRANHVSPFVQVACMLPGRRRTNGILHANSLSDVLRAAKRVRAWTSVAFSISEHWPAGMKTSTLSPVDTRVSKRTWEQTMYRIRQSLLVLNSCPQSDVADVREGLNGNSRDEERDAQLHGQDGLQAEIHPDYIGGSSSDALPCKEILDELPCFLFDVQFLSALAATCKSLLAAVRAKSNWTDRTVYVDRLQPSDGATLRIMTRLLTSARHVCISVAQLTQFQRIPTNAVLCWTAETCSPLLQQSSYMVGFRSESPLMGFACFSVQIPNEACGLYIGVQESNTGKRSYCRVDNIGSQNIAWSFGLGDAPPVLHPSASRHEPHPGQQNSFFIRWNQRHFFIALNQAGVSSATLQGSEAVAAGPLSHVFMWIFCRQIPSPIDVRAVPSPIDRSAMIRCAICRRSYSLVSPRWRVCLLCHAWICEDHQRLHPDRLCPHCVMQLSDYVGGSTNLFPLLDESPQICVPSSCSRLMRLYRLCDRLNTIMRLHANEIPFQVIEDAFAYTMTRFEIIAAITGDEIKTLLFMAVPRFSVPASAMCYCLLMVGDHGLDHAVVVPFVPRPSWDGLWSFLEMSFGFSRPRGASFQVRVNDLIFSENDDLAWLPPHCLARLTVTSPTTTQLVLPPWNNVHLGWPQTEEAFVRWFRSQWTIEKIHSSRSRGLCSMCRKPLTDVCRWRELVQSGHLGIFCTNACASVKHTFRINRRGAHEPFEAMLDVPACVLPSVLELHAGCLYAYGHEARRFELLPGPLTGDPIWVESDGLSIGCTSLQGLPCNSYLRGIGDYSGGSSKVNDAYLCLLEGGPMIALRGCFYVDKVRTLILNFLQQSTQGDTQMFLLPSHPLQNCSRHMSTPTLLHPQPVRLHSLFDIRSVRSDWTAPEDSFELAPCRN